MVTVAVSMIPTGGEVESILRMNSSLSSNILSLFIIISNEDSFDPAGNVTLYGPDS